IRGSVFFLDYENNTFDRETVGSLDASIVFKISEEVLSWFVQENFGQQIINPFQAVTPDNRENVNFFTTGPRLAIPLCRRALVNVEASYSDVNYEDRPLDNERFGARLGIERVISASRSVSINVDGDRIEYDDDVLNPSIDRINAFLRFDSETARNDFVVDLGWNQIERLGEKSDGLLADIVWHRYLSPTTTISLNGGTKFSSDGDIFRFNQQLDNQFGGTQDVQSVSDPFQNDYVRLELGINKSRTRANLRLFWSAENFENITALDRTLSGARLNVSREVSRSLSISLFGTFTRREYDNVVRDDDDLSFGAEISWHIGTRTTVSLRGERFERNTDIDANEYEENRAFLTFTYRPFAGR
ncbi:MAG: outer membrane beta-barrel protein, partial [Proteobacteria bacterium]|nr:outer membrane beta-barrel protein [Pseudomonadota bacterium]